LSTWRNTPGSCCANEREGMTSENSIACCRWHRPTSPCCDRDWFVAAETACCVAQRFLPGDA
jgi:hypothetical protein